MQEAVVSTLLSITLLTKKCRSCFVDIGCQINGVLIKLMTAEKEEVSLLKHNNFNFQVLNFDHSFLGQWILISYISYMSKTQNSNNNRHMVMINHLQNMAQTTLSIHNIYPKFQVAYSCICTGTTEKIHLYQFYLSGIILAIVLFTQCLNEANIHAFILIVKASFDKSFSMRLLVETFLVSFFCFPFSMHQGLGSW